MKKENTVVHQLSLHVNRQFGKEVNTATDCINLANLLMQNFQVHISAQTLRRFFGLIKSASSSSQFTLDLLSKYCGYQDFKNFSYSFCNDQLERFFGNTEDNTQNYWQRSEQLCKNISGSPELLISTHQRLMTFPMARKYFMENHPMRDLLGTVYAQYFSSYLKFSRTTEAKIFAFGFLFQSAFLLGNEEFMELFYKKVAELELTEEVHVIPAGLKHGIQLLYADYTGNKYLYRKYVAEMKKSRLDYVKASEKSVCSFEYTVLESLIFTHRTEEMRFLMENKTCQKELDEYFVPDSRKDTHEEVWKILCAEAYHKMGEETTSELYLNEVDLEKLGIGWEKYYSLMYYFTQLKSTKFTDKTTLISKIKILLRETSFSYYEDVLTEYLKVSDQNRIFLEEDDREFLVPGQSFA